MTKEESMAIDDHLRERIIEEDLRELERLRRELAEVVAEVRRLKGLIKDAEWQGSCCYDPFCAWCGDSQSYGQQKAGHRPACPAFTPDGVVR